MSSVTAVVFYKVNVGSHDALSAFCFLSTLSDVQKAHESSWVGMILLAIVRLMSGHVGVQKAAHRCCYDLQ